MAESLEKFQPYRGGGCNAPLLRDAFSWHRCLAVSVPIEIIDRVKTIDFNPLDWHTKKKDSRCSLQFVFYLLKALSASKAVVFVEKATWVSNPLVKKKVLFLHHTIEIIQENALVY